MSLIRNYTTVGGATLVSRLTGFVRDMLIAAVLGASAVADAYIAAFLLPNLFRRVLSEGAFNAAFVPIFLRRQAAEGEDSARQYARNALSSLTILVIAALVAAEILMPWIIATLTPGFAAQPQKLGDAIVFGRIAFIFVGTIIVAALIASLLNALGRYMLVAFAPLVLNILLIGVLSVLVLCGWREDMRSGLAMVITVLVAGLLQLTIVLAGAARAGLDVRLGWPRIDPDVRRLLWLMIPGLLLAGAGHFNMVVAAQLSSGLPSAVAWLYYADRIFQLPLGFVAAAIGTVLLPEVARALGAGDTSGASQAGNRALEFGMMLVLPAALALAVLADPIVNVIYRRGAFSTADSTATAAILQALAVGLPGFVLVKVLLPPYLAREEMRLPIAAALSGIAANIAMTLLLLPSHQHVAAAIGVALSAWVNAALLAGGLVLQGTFGMDAMARRNLPRIAAASLGTGAVALGLKVVMAPWLTAETALAIRVLTVGSVCALGLLAHAIMLKAFGVADVSAAVRTFNRRKAS